MHPRQDKKANAFASLFAAPTPKTIYVADAPPARGGQLQQISPEEFARQCGMQGWTESLLADPETVNDIKNLKCDHEIKLAKAGFDLRMAAISDNVDKLCIAYINSAVGYGVFAREAIPANCVIALYSGVIRPVKDPHLFEGGDYEFALKSGEATAASVDAEEYGGLARFIQHIPDKNDYRFASHINPDQVAGINLKISICLFAHVPILFLETKKSVKPGEQLGFNYSLDAYWSEISISPSLFDIFGGIINQDDYTPNKICINIDCQDGNTIRVKTSHDHMNKMFQIQDDICIECNGMLVTISKDAYYRAVRQSPRSPFIHIDNPTSIKPAAARPQSPAASTVSALTLFSETDHGKQITASLKRITQEFTKHVRWAYLSKLQSAALVMDDRETLNSIANHLNANLLSTAIHFDDNGSNPFLFVTRPLISQLEQTPAMHTEMDKRSGKCDVVYSQNLLVR
jgi:hypothetical protein